MNKTFHAYIQTGSKEDFPSLAQRFAEQTMRADANAAFRMKQGSHPDYLCILPDGAAIKVNQVRDCLCELSVRPYEGGQRVVAIQCAEAMTEQAQNALLKMLEEPPVDTVFLLLTKQPSALLPTIRSRCLMLPTTEAKRSGESNAAEALLKELRSGAGILAAAASLPGERETLGVHLDQLLEGFDAMIHRAAGECPGEPEEITLLPRLIDCVHIAQQMLSHNVNAALCAQWLCIRIKEEDNDDRRWRKI
jgi:hypothetical protein